MGATWHWDFIPIKSWSNPINLRLTKSLRCEPCGGGKYIVSLIEKKIEEKRIVIRRRDTSPGSSEISKTCKKKRLFGTTNRITQKRYLKGAARRRPMAQHCQQWLSCALGLYPQPSLYHMNSLTEGDKVDERKMTEDMWLGTQVSDFIWHLCKWNRTVNFGVNAVECCRDAENFWDTEQLCVHAKKWSKKRMLLREGFPSIILQGGQPDGVGRLCLKMFTRFNEVRSWLGG